MWNVGYEHFSASKVGHAVISQLSSNWLPHTNKRSEQQVGGASELCA